MRTLLAIACAWLLSAGCAEAGPPAEAESAGAPPSAADTLPAAALEASERPGAGRSSDSAEAAEVPGTDGVAERVASPPATEGPGPDADPADGSAAGPPPAPVEVPGKEGRPEFERPEQVRGLYVNAWTAGSRRRMEDLLEVARRTEINSFVIDIKDASGFVSHATGVEEVREAGAAGEIRIPDLPGLLSWLEDEGVYPIARVVIVKDPVLVAARPELAVQDTAGGVWVDGKGIRWLNLFDERVWEYHIALAEEVVRLGFPEVQWDYVRFPDAPKSEIRRARYPGRDGRSLTEATRAFLQRSREELSALGAVVTADVFGVTTSAGDVGIGQVWEDFIDVVDVALPMVYPSHYWRGSFGIDRPNAHPYAVVRKALRDALARSGEVEGAGRTRPWLQDFTLGEPAYGPPEVRAQIQATYDAGIGEWVLWNPGSRFTVEALEPAGGWEDEPLMRVASRIVPVSERHETLRKATPGERGLTQEVPPTETDTLRARPDTAGSR